MRRCVMLMALAGCGGEAAAERESGSGSAAAPTPTPRAHAAATPAPDDPDGFAVLRASTPLHRRPSGEAPSVTFEPRGLGTDEPFAAFEIVEHEGPWIKIRNLTADAGKEHCAGHWSALADFELFFWVRTTDVHLVTRRPVMSKFTDGTSAMVSAGVPVTLAGRIDDATRYLASGPGAGAELPLDDDAVGRFYRPSALYRPDEPVQTLPRSAGLLMEGRALDNAVLLGPTEQAVSVFGQERREDGTLVTVGTRCAELRAMARGEAPEPVEDLDAELEAATGVLAALGASADRSYAFEPKTPVFWHDGEDAGITRGAVSFDVEPTKVGDKRCFEHANLTLCLRADDATITEPEAFPPAGLGYMGSTGFPRGLGGSRGLVGRLGGRPRSPTTKKKRGKVRAAKASVKGSLPTTIIARVVRLHLNEVRYCYAAGLTRDPALEGRIAVQFTIGPTGRVPVSVVATNSMKSRTVGNCIAKAVKRWKFPKPTGGGNVVVTYPFVFSPS